MFDDIGVGITFVMKNYEETKGKISGIQKALEGVENSKVEKPIKEVSKHTSNFNNGLKKALTSVKKLGFALLTVRGIWFAIRKAMTSYLAQNDELKNKLDAIYYALGSLFSPLLEIMVNWLIKAIAYIDVLAKALGFAGINMTNFGKSSKEAKKSLAGFDEINNINNNDSGSGITNPFANVQLDDGIVATLKKIGSFLKPIIDRIREMDLESLVRTISEIAIGYGLWKTATNLLSGAFGKKNDVLETQSGLESTALLALPLLALAYESVKNSVNGLSDAFDRLSQGEVWNAMGNLATAITEVTDNVKKKLEETGTNMANCKSNVLLALEETLLGIAGFKANAILKFNEFIENSKQGIKDWATNTKNNISNWGTTTNTSMGRWKNTAVATIALWATNFGTNVYNALNSAGTNVNNFCRTTSTNFSSWCQNTATNIGNWASTIAESVGNALESAWETFKSFKIATGERVTGWFTRQRSTFSTTLSAVGLTLATLVLRKTPLASYDVGTNYVPNDMIAQVHKGEAIVPKRFNEQQFFNNEETNALLETLIQRVDNLEINPYITVRDIGQASVKYINQQSRVLGSSLV